ncbi:PREDICTED: synaptotagmin-1-like isoform X1 [Atta colombica]|uniref:synaptotagmin-1-like isoform X1 n=1 Tax=Atta colombica TaxID=520822 RepID=UPI00084CC7BA|nr:PREDICTED: synaptotagmin-1-like isoform X1 [Atta colombica]XP_018047144.1 PREDICTED: synaptotagmin-1-like isoform X1 [Atta colombica]XP_018047145.1 PREDICTED: synaptotagmin-1-like isoform X1 [Atta colombica]XP_018047146.1 PREDICTED: synaptotagmin-1-like isoform X1 [Atta colombica]
MLHEDFLGPWGLLIIIVIGVGIILIALLLFVCFLMPGCIGYEYFRKQRKEVKSVPLQTKNQEKNLKLNDISYRSWRLGSLYENDSNGVISENAESQRNSFNSTTAQYKNMDCSSTLNLIYPDKQKNDKKMKEFPIELTMSLQYLPPCDNIIPGKLVIGIEALCGLPPKQYNGTLEPYVVLNIMKQSWSYKKRQKLHSFRTRVIKHTASPIYKETFVIANIKPQEAKEWILDITAYDHDRYANHTELCSLKVLLKNMKKIFYNPEIHMFNYKMKPSYQEFGHILLAVSYLPTAERLTINIMKLRDIKFISTGLSLNEFNPYVKVLMLNGKTGKKMKKKKTKYLCTIAQPEFNETLTFNLPVTQLDTVQFLVVLCGKVLPEGLSANTVDASDSEDSVSSFKKSTDIFIGKVALGKGVRGSTERLHWFSVLQNPRKLVTVWHTLK